MMKKTSFIVTVSLLIIYLCIAYVFRFTYSTKPPQLVFHLSNRSVPSRNHRVTKTDEPRSVVAILHNMERNAECDSLDVKREELLLINNSSRLPANITGAILWPYFYRGLTNQRIAMRNSITLAAKIRRPIIITPLIQSRQKFAVAGKSLPWLKIPITKIYDVKFLISCLREKGIAALYPCYPDSCVPRFIPPRLGQKDIEDGHNSSLPFVVANFDTFFVKMPSTPYNPPSDIDDCIRSCSDITSCG